MTITSKMDVSLALNLLKCTLFYHLKYVNDWHIFDLNLVSNFLAFLIEKIFVRYFNITANFVVSLQRHGEKGCLKFLKTLPFPSRTSNIILNSLYPYPLFNNVIYMVP